MNLITRKEFENNRKTEFTVISFSVNDQKIGERTSTYSGLGAIKALNHIQKEQLRGRICILAYQENAHNTDRNFNAFFRGR